MKKSTWLAAFLCAVVSMVNVSGQESPSPGVSVTASGKVFAKPDLAIVSMSIKSTSTLASDALTQNTKKVADVKARLLALGFKDNQLKFSGHRFSAAGGPFFGAQRQAGFDVNNFVFVFLEGAELKDGDQLSTRVSSILDDLGKAGATPVDTPISRAGLGTDSIVLFTVKDPAPYEKEAHQQAIENARLMGEDIAKRSKTQITGIESINLGVIPRFQDQIPNPLEELGYRYYSASINQVAVYVSANVRFSYKKQ